MASDRASAEGDERGRTRHGARPGPLRTVAAILVVLIAIVLAFFAIRLSADMPNLAAGTVPDNTYDRRYVEHPWLAYLHIVPGNLYVVGAPLQLSRRFRTHHYAVHRRLGRALLSLQRDREHAAEQRQWRALMWRRRRSRAGRQRGKGPLTTRLAC